MSVPLLVAAIALAQSSKLGSYIPYRNRMRAIEEKFAKASSPHNSSDIIIKDVRSWFKNKDSHDDVELLAAIYKLVFRSYILCFWSDHEVHTWTLEMAKLSGKLKPSLEKQICLAYLDQNNEGWLVPKYPEWKASPILACILARRSSMWCSKQSRYPIFTDVYNEAVKLRPKSTVLGEGLDASYANAQFQVFHEKKYMRLYIDRSRKYISHTPDPKNRKAIQDDLNLLESLHFPKK